MKILYQVDFPSNCLGTQSTTQSDPCSLPVCGDQNMCFYLPLQAVSGAAASDGVGARVCGPHRTQTQLLRGQ